MPTPNTNKKFESFKLETEIFEGYCTHTIPHGSSPQKEKWIKGKELGYGTYGEVWVEKKETGEARAVKKLSKDDGGLSSRELLAFIELNEFPEHFVQFFGWFEAERDIYFAMEYIQYGDLDNYIHKYRDNKPVSEGDSRVIMKQLLHGVLVMHDMGFCHRDLKPQNILVASWSPTINVKITDFGVTKRVVGDLTELRTEVGTRNYIAPEVQGFISEDTSTYSNAADIWSLGCLLFEILTRDTPFPAHTGLHRYTMSEKFPEKKLTEIGASPEAIAFLSKIMKPHPDDRLTARQALQESWL